MQKALVKKGKKEEIHHGGRGGEKGDDCVVRLLIFV